MRPRLFGLQRLISNVFTSSLSFLLAYASWHEGNEGKEGRQAGRCTSGSHEGDESHEGHQSSLNLLTRPNRQGDEQHKT